MPSLTVPQLLDQVKTSALSALIPHSLDFYKTCVLEGLAHRSLEITHCDLEVTVTSREDGLGREDGRKMEGRKEDGKRHCAVSGSQASVGTQQEVQAPDNPCTGRCIPTAGGLPPDLHSASRGEGNSGGKGVTIHCRVGEGKAEPELGPI